MQDTVRCRMNCKFSSGGLLNIKLSSYQYRIPMLKIRRYRDRLIFNMGITIPGKDGLYIETGPRILLTYNPLVTHEGEVWDVFSEFNVWSMIHVHICIIVNTLRLTPNGCYFADIFKCIFLNENVLISIKISLKFIPKGPINNIPALAQIMAWRRRGDKPLSESMMIILLTHKCVTRPQWVNQYCVMLHHVINVSDVYTEVHLYVVPVLQLPCSMY